MRFGPWITVVLLILTLPILLFALGLGAIYIPFGGIGYTSRFGVLTIFVVVQIGLMIAALPGLFARKMAGWRLLVYSQLIAIVYNTLSGNIVGGLLFGLIALYILFQIRTLYHESGNEQRKTNNEKRESHCRKAGRPQTTIHMRDVPDPVLRTESGGGQDDSRRSLRHRCRDQPRAVWRSAAGGRVYLILGHENFGVVEEVGKKVKGFKASDLVVATVRRPCKCYTCKAGQIDMCHEGGYQERGIVGSHGFLSEYYVESPQWLNRIPEEHGGDRRAARADVGRRKGHRSRVPAAAAYRVETQDRPGARRRPDRSPGRRSHARARARHPRGRAQPETDQRAQLARKMGATYHSVAEEDPPRSQKRDTADRHRRRGNRSRERRVRRHANSRT